MEILSIQTSKEIPQKNVSTSNDEIDLCKKLGLKNQELAYEIEKKGVKVIRREDIRGIMALPENVRIRCYSISEYLGKIPYGILCKIDEFKAEKMFRRMSILAPAMALPLGQDPLLIGEILPDHSSKIYSDSDVWENQNFWDRETLIGVIAKWE